MPLSTIAMLGAPSVQEADGAFLRPDMIPLGPTVHIPRYDGRAIGDRITLTWTGGPSSEGHWSDQKVLDTVDGDIVFNVPVLVLAAAESYDVATGYVLKRHGSDVDEPSGTASYTVRNHPPLRAIQIRDQNGAPTSTIDHAAEWFEAELLDELSLSLQRGDEVIFWLRTMDLFASTTILATSEAAIITIDEEPQHPVRHRFGRRIVEANNGNTLLLHCAVVRANGYVQHAETDFTLTITQEPALLTRVLTAQLHEDEVFLDRPEFEDGLAVVIPYQAEMKGTHIRFCLGDYRTSPIPAREGKPVEARIPKDELHRQANTNCYLYCLALKGSDAQETVVERSLRRHMTIRHSLAIPPFPEPDMSLDAPSIDGYPGGPMDQAHFPGGPFARIGATAAVAKGDVVTCRFHTTAGLVVWEASDTVDEEHVGMDIVFRIPMANIAYYRYAMPSLYYSVESAAGMKRFSRRLDVPVREYAPRTLYYLACSMRYSMDGEALLHCPPDAAPLLVLESTFLGLAQHDRLVVMLRGVTGEASAIIDTTIGTEPDSRLAIPVPAAVIRDNAGHDISYRVTKIRGRYIEHTPYRTLSVDARS